MKLKSKTCQSQPEWVCIPCGEKWGSWWTGGTYKGPQPHVATFHEGECGVCGNTRSVTEARDFGYLLPDWDLSA